MRDEQVKLHLFKIVQKLITHLFTLDDDIISDVNSNTIHQTQHHNANKSA